MRHREPGKTVLWEARRSRAASLPTTFLYDFHQKDLLTCPEGSPGSLRFGFPLWERGVVGRLTADGRDHFHLQKTCPKFTPVLANLVSECTSAYLQRQSTLNLLMQTLGRYSFCSHHSDNEALVKKNVSRLKIFHPDLRRCLVVTASGWKQLFLDPFKISTFKMSHNISDIKKKKKKVKKSS